MSRSTILVGALVFALLVAFVPFWVTGFLLPLDRVVATWQAWYSVLMAFVGLVVVNHLQFAFTREEARRKRNEDRDGLIRALYMEIYNRTARIAKDAGTWFGFAATKEHISLSRFRKFRPADPVVFSGNPNLLPLLPPKVLAAVMMFYFRLDAIRRDAEKDPTMAVGASAGFGGLAQREVEIFSGRLKEAAQPAINALDALGELIPERKTLDTHLERAHVDFLQGVEIRDALRNLN